jgi:hypothetical protein
MLALAPVFADDALPARIGPMNRSPLPDRWTDNAGWLAQAIDPNSRLIRLVRMDEAAYRAASFLDDRMLQTGVEARLCSLDDAMSETAALQRDDARWIFHIGHVGSTLISRLLGELDGVLSIREPRSLRDLAIASDEERVSLASGLRRLMARSFDPGQAALVKATSSVSEIAPLLAAPGALVLFLYAAPTNYMAGILAGENSVEELEALHDVRLERLRGRGIDLAGFDRSDAHRTALAWTCEMTSLEAAADAMSDRQILWADFDRMLSDMSGWIERCADHFCFAASRDRIEELVAGPLMCRYSKALEFDYSPSLRAALLADATRRHGADIEVALGALSDAAKSAPLLAWALRRAEGES